MDQPKFIITSAGQLRFGMVEMHRDLLRPDEYCLGGGYYTFDYADNRMLLHGRSYDYGEPQWGRLDELHLPQALDGLRIVWQEPYGRDVNLADLFPLKFNL